MTAGSILVRQRGTVHYPGENVDINHSAGSGIWLGSCSYAAVRGGNGGTLTLHGATAAESANIMLYGTHQVAADLVCYGSRWSNSDNVAGAKMSGIDCVFNRIVCYDNQSTSGPNPLNVSNFLVYNDTAGSTKWIMNCKGWSSYWNVKIKHTNADTSTVIIHNVENIECGFVGAGKNSSIRYNIFYNSDTGMRLGLSDPSSYTQAAVAMLIEQNTVISTLAAADCLTIDGTYLTGVNKIYRNIFHQSNGAPGSGNDVRKFFQIWVETPIATVQARPIDCDYNCFYNSTSTANGWIVGSNGVSPTTYDFTGYKALTGAGITRDPHSFTSAPGFGNVATGDLTITSASNAATQAGTGKYAGAFKPDRSYGTVGAKNTTLLEFIQGASGGGVPAVVCAAINRARCATRGRGKVI